MAETATWKTASWDTPGGTTVTAAAFAPSGRALLIAFGSSSSSTSGRSRGSSGDGSSGSCGGGGVVALHFVGDAPSLLEQLLPVTLPEVTSLDV